MSMFIPGQRVRTLLHGYGFVLGQRGDTVQVSIGGAHGLNPHGNPVTAVQLPATDVRPVRLWERVLCR